MANIEIRFNSVNLDDLAATVCSVLRVSRQDRCYALHHDLAAGDALLKAQESVSSDWKRWLRENCFLSVRTALLYIWLARHRKKIEAEIGRMGELSSRAAVRLITEPTGKVSKPKKLVSDLLTAWRAASEIERNEALSSIDVVKFYTAMPMNCARTSRSASGSAPASRTWRTTPFLSQGIRTPSPRAWPAQGGRHAGRGWQRRARSARRAKATQLPARRCRHR